MSVPFHHETLAAMDAPSLLRAFDHAAQTFETARRKAETIAEAGLIMSHAPLTHELDRVLAVAKGEEFEAQQRLNELSLHLVARGVPSLCRSLLSSTPAPQQLEACDA